MSKKIAAIICSAGASKRFAQKTKKPFVEIAGRAVLLRSIDFFANRDDVIQTIVAIDPQDEEMVKIRFGANLSFYGVKLCYGGDERFQTVKNALEIVDEKADLVAIHDVARCCLKDQWLDQLFETAAKTGAAMLACPITATIKKVKNGKIIETIDRSNLYEAQTPQVFDKELIKKAYQNPPFEDKTLITDDSMLLEAMGKEVTIVETDSSNIKITTKNDVEIAEAIIRSRPKPKPQGPIGPYVEAQW